MVGMGVRKKDVIEAERHAVTHHLTLGSLSAVEQKRLTFSDNGEPADAAFDGRARGRCA
jgi:hypothetical protein